MTVGIERGHLKLSDDLVKEVNRHIRSFTPHKYRISTAKYEKLLGKKNLTVESKKKKLLKALHEVIVKTLSLDPHKISSAKIILDDLKLNVRLIRGIITKLRDINYYLEAVFLKEVGLKEKPQSWLQSMKKTKNAKEKQHLGRKDIDKLEHTIHQMISRVITLDEKLLKAYKKKDVNIVKDERVGIKDLEKLLGKESDLLMHLEAKFPPPNKVKAELIDAHNFNHWVARILTALTGIEHLYQKESKIFQKLKQSRKLRRKVLVRIDYVLNEKLKFMQIKEQRVLSWESVGKIDNALHEAAHNYLAASQL